MLTKNIISFALKIKYGFLWSRKKITIKKLFSGYNDEYIKRPNINRIVFMNHLKKKFIKMKSYFSEKKTL